MTNFKSKVPEGMWPLADLVKEQFDAAVNSDTLKHIEALKTLLNDFGQNNTPTIEELGRYQILVGLYDEGINTLKRLLGGEEETISGLYYIRCLYNIGWAYYKLGNTEEAKKHFEEVLSYWGDADFDIKEVLNSRKYLSELQS